MVWTLTECVGDLSMGFSSTFDLFDGSQRIYEVIHILV